MSLKNPFCLTGANKSSLDEIGGQSAVRQMTRAELLGQHTHPTTQSVNVHVWIRDGKYIARGRCDGRAFGETLGDDPSVAAGRLRHLLVEIDNGTYVRSADRPRRQLRRGAPPRLDVRALCDEFLTERRKVVGKRTTQDYQSRLGHLIEFAEQPTIRRNWPTAGDLDRDFAVSFRSFLFERRVSRNGRPSAEVKPMAPGHVFNVLDCSRTLVSWAKNPAINLLPSWAANPFTADLVGQRPAKDPLRAAAFPLAKRIALVGHMDQWQLLHLTWRMVLPLRPEDFAGLLLSDVDFNGLVFSFRSRFGGGDFNKGRQDFSCPFPSELAEMLDYCVGARAAGPLLRQRQVFEGRRQPPLPIGAPEDVTGHLQSALSNAVLGDLQSPQDHKRVIRDCIRQMGGISEDCMSKELKRLFVEAGIVVDQNTYKLRASVNTELEAAGVSQLVQRYVTGHHANDILNHYVTLDPNQQMRKYFDTLGPLFDAIRTRGDQLSLKL